MTTPTPAAQKLESLWNWMRDNWRIIPGERDRKEMSAIIDREMNQWQDIATAPKDGTPIMAAYDPAIYGTLPIIIVKWRKHEWKENCEGWFPDSFESPHHVTRWQPLPPPPCPATAKP